MEKLIRFNDTLKLTNDQGFPTELDISLFRDNALDVDLYINKSFSFDKPLARLYPLPPTRTFLVHEHEGKWIQWGHCLVLEQTIYQMGERTKGIFQITHIHDYEFMKQVTTIDVPAGKSYFSS